MNDNSNGYGSVARLIHWFSALIIIGMLAFGFFMDDMPKAYKPMIYFWHKSFGLLVLGLVFFRVIWHLIKGKPAYAKSLTRLEQILSTVVHHTLYLLMFIMPLSGLFMSVAANRIPSFFGLFDINVPWIPHTKSFSGLMNQSHEILAWIFIAIVFLHIAAGAKHYMLKDGVFNRMLGK